MMKKIFKKLRLGINLQGCMIPTNLSCELRLRFLNIFVVGEQSGSAILLSFFIMTLLILASIGISFLVIRDVSTVRTIASGMQSEYAAEGMTELGLLELERNLPGYEPSFADYKFSTAASASLGVSARGNIVPCDLSGDEWRALGMNESVQLALFAQTDPAGTIEKIEDWYVEFWVGDADGNAAVYSDFLNVDVLRWKVLGMSGGQTEALSEYIAMNDAHFSSENPSIFGSDETALAAAPEDYSYAQYYQDMGAYYVYNDHYSISQFLTGHDYNYLILTNVIGGGDENDIVYFRLHSNAKQAVCEYVQLASGAEMEFGSTEQNLDTLVREGENLPVFDFVLYHTAEGE